MEYGQIEEAVFVRRPNRFIAFVDLNGQEVLCHVKNTGRCRELLTPGARVFLEYDPLALQKGRRTQYDLVAVYKGGLLINMDSQAPNRAAWEWLNAKKDWNISDLRREVVFEDSRFDLSFCRQQEGRTVPCLMEVKGVTLEDQGVAMFPDAPTQRGIKHLEGLIRARRQGYECWVLFVIQMKGVHVFTPNTATHPAFGETLKKAAQEGVRLLAMDCLVTKHSMNIHQPVPVSLP